MTSEKKREHVTCERKCEHETRESAKVRLVDKSCFTINGSSKDFLIVYHLLATIWLPSCLTRVVLQFFFEASSKNKMLKSGSYLLYQVFPGNHVGWHRQFIKAIKENEVESVKNIVTFFKTNRQFINAKEQNTGNTALHHACRGGCYVSLYRTISGSVWMYHWIGSSYHCVTCYCKLKVLHWEIVAPCHCQLTLPPSKETRKEEHTSEQQTRPHSK